MQSQFERPMEENGTTVCAAPTTHGQKQTTPLYHTSSLLATRYSSHQCQPPAPYSQNQMAKQRNRRGRQNKQAKAFVVFQDKRVRDKFLWAARESERNVMFNWKRWRCPSRSSSLRHAAKHEPTNVMMFSPRRPLCLEIKMSL